MRIRVGIVGYGKMGQLRRRMVEGHPAFEVAALCDPELEAGREDGRVLVVQDYSDLLSAELDAVFVCTPNHVAAEIISAAMDSGRHVFAEKPPGRNLDDVRAILLAEARNSRLKLKFGFNHRYHESVRMACAAVQDGRMGQLLWMRGVYGKSGGRGFEDTWRSRRVLAGGGILLDQGIHMLDLFRLFAGEFEDVKSFVGSSYWPIDVEDNAFALLRNARGQTAVLHSSSTQWKHTFLLELGLTEGYLVINGLVTGSRSYGRETLIVGRRQFEGESYALGNPREEMIYFDQDLSWEREIAEFADVIQNDRPVSVGTSRDAFEVMALIERIYQADPTWASAPPDARPAEAKR